LNRRGQGQYFAANAGPHRSGLRRGGSGILRTRTPYGTAGWNAATWRHGPVADDMRQACASREVVLSAGTINSPQLLELSGIGQPQRLRSLGIEVRHALDGVGENLRDHYVPRTRWRIGKKGITFSDRGRGLRLAHQAMRYALFRQGMLAMTGAPIRAFVCCARKHRT
jgi:choline dehydrogenase-like flavoprotein